MITVTQWEDLTATSSCLKRTKWFLAILTGSCSPTIPHSLATLTAVNMLSPTRNTYIVAEIITLGIVLWLAYLEGLCGWVVTTNCGFDREIRFPCNHDCSDVGFLQFPDHWCWLVFQSIFHDEETCKVQLLLENIPGTKETLSVKSLHQPWTHHYNIQGKTVGTSWTNTSDASSTSELTRNEGLASKTSVSVIPIHSVQIFEAGGRKENRAEISWSLKAS